MPTAPTQPSVRVVKQFNYRGDPNKEFSNRYFFNGAALSSAADWHTFFDALVLLERTMWSSGLKVTHCFGYAPGSEIAVADKAYTTAGNLTPGVGVAVPGDCAAVCRFGTTKQSTKNHKVYVFSYWHNVLTNSTAGTPDVLMPVQRTAMEAYGQQWVDGFTVAGRLYKRTTPDGHLVEGRLVEPWIGHRDFPS